MRAESLMPPIHKHFKAGAELITDMNQSHRYSGAEYVHSVINKTGAYVRGHIYANGLENFWSLTTSTTRRPHRLCAPCRTVAFGVKLRCQIRKR